MCAWLSDIYLKDYYEDYVLNVQLDLKNLCDKELEKEENERDYTAIKNYYLRHDNITICDLFLLLNYNLFEDRINDNLNDWFDEFGDLILNDQVWHKVEKKLIQYFNDPIFDSSKQFSCPPIKSQEVLYGEYLLHCEKYFQIIYSAYQKNLCQIDNTTYSFADVYSAVYHCVDEEITNLLNNIVSYRNSNRHRANKF